MTNVEATCGFEHHEAGSDLLVMFGPTLLVDIGFDPEFDPLKGTVPSSAVTAMPALVDTGATESCIDALLAARLDLPIVDRREVSGVHGAREVNMYMAQIRVPSLDFTIYGAFAGVDLISGGQQHHALIGRTFLRNFTMYYEGKSGRVVIAHP